MYNKSDTNKSFAQSVEEWIQKSNANHIRSNCANHTNFIFKTPEDYNTALEAAVSNFWSSYGMIVCKRVFPEIHMGFLAVEVYHLKDAWNDRNIDLRQAVLAELRRKYIEFAQSRGFSLSAWFSVVITNIWLVDNLLVIEIPCSVFPVQYPHLARILVSEEYKILIEQLNKKSKL